MSTNFDINQVKPKKISLKEGVIFTKIARKIKIRQFKREIMTVLNQLRKNIDNYSDTEKEELANIEKIKNKKEKEEKLRIFYEKQTTNAGIEVGVDVVLYIVEMIGEAENEVIELISTYSKQPYDVVAEADIEDVIEVLKIMWKNGLYKIFAMFLNKKEDTVNDDDLKKTK